MRITDFFFSPCFSDAIANLHIQRSFCMASGFHLHLSNRNLAQFGFGDIGMTSSRSSISRPSQSLAVHSRSLLIRRRDMCTSKEQANGGMHAEQDTQDPDMDQEWEARRARFYNVSGLHLIMNDWCRWSRCMFTHKEIALILRCARAGWL